jgi:hypothetical protein
MAGQHSPGYHARRRRIERAVLGWFRTERPDEYRQAWQAAELKETAGEDGGGLG